MKLSTIAYRTPLPAKPGQRGREAVKGEKVKLSDLFETEKASFRTKKINLYGRKHSVRYYAATPFPPLRDVLSILGCIGGLATLGGVALCVVEGKSKKGERQTTNET